VSIIQSVEQEKCLERAEDALRAVGAQKLPGILRDAFVGRSALSISSAIAQAQEWVTGEIEFFETNALQAAAQRLRELSEATAETK
jgi:hypothetical protein